MRANHANQTPPPSTARGGTWRLPWPGRRGSARADERRGDGRRWSQRLPRPGTLAAGGAVLAAQVCGLGLGVSEAYAAGSSPSVAPAGSAAVERSGGGRSALRSSGNGTGVGAGVGAVESTGSALVGRLTDTAGPLLENSAAPVERVLQEQIRAGGLPLPGHAATVPDAFSIASGLVPGIPVQGRGSVEGADVQRASRSTGNGPAGPGRGTTEAAVPAQRTATAVTAVAPVAEEHPSGTRTVPSARDGSPTADTPAEGDRLALAAATPARPDGGDTGTAVLVPIAAGLLLTGAAMYKHRGLPRGH